MVRQYKSRINEDSQVTFESKDEAFSIYKEGTYYGDLLREINDNPNVSSLIINSRVQKMYTIVALLSLTSKRLCSVANLSEASAVVDPNLWRLKNKVSLLRTIMVEAVAAFGKVGLHFPIKGLNELVVSLDGAESVIMLDKKGCLEIESVVRIMTLASSSSTKMSHYEAVLDSLIKLSLQISMDNLNPNELEQITNVYRIFSQHEANPTEKKFTQRRY